VVTVHAWFRFILKGTLKDWVMVGINALYSSGFAHHALKMSGGAVAMEVIPKEIFSHSLSMPSLSFARDDESEVHEWGDCRVKDDSNLSSFWGSVSDSSLGRFGVLSPTPQRSMLWCNSETRDQNDSHQYLIVEISSPLSNDFESIPEDFSMHTSQRDSMLKAAKDGIFTCMSHEIWQ
jgi:hypothetical protein